MDAVPSSPERPRKTSAGKLSAASPARLSKAEARALGARLAAATCARAGSLKKKGKVRWQARWFTLSSTGTLSYYADEKAARAHSTVMGAFECAHMGEPRSDGKDGTFFSLEAGGAHTEAPDGGGGGGGGGCVSLRAADAEDAMEWMAAIAGVQAELGEQAVHPARAPTAPSPVPEEAAAAASAAPPVGEGEGEGETAATAAANGSGSGAGGDSASAVGDGGLGAFGGFDSTAADGATSQQQEQEGATAAEAATAARPGSNSVTFKEETEVFSVPGGSDGAASGSAGISSSSSSGGCGVGSDTLIKFGLLAASVAVAVFAYRKRQ